MKAIVIDATGGPRSASTKRLTHMHSSQLVASEERYC